MWYNALLALEMLWTAKTFKLSIYHDGNTATQRFAFFHAKTKIVIKTRSAV